MHRLSKEEYYYMNKMSVWTVDVAANFFASFEMESSKAFNNSRELFCFDIFMDKHSNYNIFSMFKQCYEKWEDKIATGFFSEGILFKNIDDNVFDIADTEGREFCYANTCFYKDDILSYFDRLVRRGELYLDVISLYDFLDGKGTAPADPIFEGSSASNLASSKTIIVKKKIKKYVSELMKSGCGCWHTAMRDHVMNHFNQIEREDHQTKDKDKVSLLSKSRQLTRLREVYTELGKVDLIYDLSKHAGKQNPCSLPSHSK